MYCLSQGLRNLSSKINVKCKYVNDLYNGVCICTVQGSQVYDFVIGESPLTASFISLTEVHSLSRLWSQISPLQSALWCCTQYQWVSTVVMLNNEPIIMLFTNLFYPRLYRPVQLPSSLASCIRARLWAHRLLPSLHHSSSSSDHPAQWSLIISFSWNQIIYQMVLFLWQGRTF